jgi:hypothetical protein
LIHSFCGPSGDTAKKKQALSNQATKQPSKQYIKQAKIHTMRAMQEQTHTSTGLCRALVSKGEPSSGGDEPFSPFLLLCFFVERRPMSQVKIRIGIPQSLKRHETPLNAGDLQV